MAASNAVTAEVGTCVCQAAWALSMDDLIQKTIPTTVCPPAMHMHMHPCASSHTKYPCTVACTACKIT